MEERLKSYQTYIRERLLVEMTQQEDDELREDLLIQISFFQHERLIHLIVTVTFALLTVLTFFCTFFYQHIGLYLLLLLLLVLLIPYIRHYYILENGIQKLYQYYDKL